MEETETLKVLLEIMHEHDLDAIKVRVGEQIFEMVRREAGAVTTVLPGATGVPAAAAAPASAGPSAPAAAPATAKKITAPLVGVFYRAASPDSEDFVKIGDRVEVGQVVCILEAMKLFNEITSDYAGIVTRAIPENGELVSLGQDLFWIEP